MSSGVKQHQLIGRQFADIGNPVGHPPNRVLEQVAHGSAIAEVLVTLAMQLGEAQ